MSNKIPKINKSIKKAKVKISGQRVKLNKTQQAALLKMKIEGKLNNTDGTPEEK